MKKIRALVFSLAWVAVLVVQQPGWADESTVFEVERYFSAPQSQKVDPPLQVGDMLRFRWIGEKKPDSRATRISLPAGSKPLSELGWEIYAHPKDDPTSAFSVIPIKSGSITLPELQVEDADGKVMGRTRAIPFEVAGAGGGDTPPADYVPPLGMRFPTSWLAGLAAAVCLIAGGAGYWLWRRSRRLRRRGPGGFESLLRPLLPEHEEALAGLHKLEAEKWISQGQYKRHYFGISEILKRYIERRYGFPALELTTREMIQLLQSQGAVGPDLCARMGAIFERLDRVKFTDHVPGAVEPNEVLKEAREWIETTRRRPAAVAEATHAT